MLVRGQFPPVELSASGNCPEGGKASSCHEDGLAGGINDFFHIETSLKNHADPLPVCVWVCVCVTVTINDS